MTSSMLSRSDKREFRTGYRINESQCYVLANLHMALAFIGFVVLYNGYAFDVQPMVAVGWPVSIWALALFFYWFWAAWSWSNRSMKSHSDES